MLSSFLPVALKHLTLSIEGLRWLRTHTDTHTMSPRVQIGLEKVLRCLHKMRNEKKVKEGRVEMQGGRKAGNGLVVFKKCSQHGHGNQEHNTWLPWPPLPPSPRPHPPLTVACSLPFILQYLWCQPVQCAAVSAFESRNLIQCLLEHKLFRSSVSQES